MNIGIIGSEYSINRHLISLKKIREINISGLYQSGKQHKDCFDFYNIPFYRHPDQLINDSDSLIISDHNGCFNSKIAVDALKSGKHVFLYPQLLRSVNEAVQLTKLACEANVVLKVGNVGLLNMNSLLKAVNETAGINFIDIRYNKVYTKSFNTNPISRDLLIISQVIRGLVKGQLHSLKAKGLPLTSEKPDIINARLEFDNGCIVNINCNIVAATDEFKGMMLIKDTCINFDLLKNRFTKWNIDNVKNGESEPVIIRNPDNENNDLLFDELRGFVTSAAAVPEYHAASDFGFEPFILAEKILEKVRKVER